MIKVIATVFVAFMFVLTSSAQAEERAMGEYEHRASQLVGNMVGADVYNHQDEKIGTIDDLLIDRDNKISDAVLSVGGFLGMGDHLVAVPFDDLDIKGEPDEPTILYEATEEELEDRPEFEY